MVKVLNVTIDDHLMNDIVEDARPQGMNKSEWVRRLLSYGWEAERTRREQTNKDMRMAGSTHPTTQFTTSQSTPLYNRVVPGGIIEALIEGMRT